MLRQACTCRRAGAGLHGRVHLRQYWFLTSIIQDHSIRTCRRQARCRAPWWHPPPATPSCGSSAPPPPCPCRMHHSRLCEPPVKTVDAVEKGSEQLHTSLSAERHSNATWWHSIMPQCTSEMRIRIMCAHQRMRVVSWLCGCGLAPSSSGTLSRPPCSPAHFKICIIRNGCPSPISPAQALSCHPASVQAALLACQLRLLGLPIAQCSFPIFVVSKCIGRHAVQAALLLQARGVGNCQM